MLFLIPPSEGKNEGGEKKTIEAPFADELPLDIASNATRKDLKCKGRRYQQGMVYNRNVKDNPTMPAIERYSGTMFRYLAYNDLSKTGKKFFDKHVQIISGLYGIVKPQSLITNYKLPITAKGLYQFWNEKITNYIKEQEEDYIVDLLPNVHKRLIDWDALDAKRIRVDFYHDGKKMSHGVKGVKGVWLHNLCEEGETNPEKWEDKFTYRDKSISVKIINEDE